jgi:hypothetical protein
MNEVDPFVLAAAIGLSVLAVALIAGALVLELRGYQDWANTPTESHCRCGHSFSEHASDPHGPTSRCAGLVDSWECTVPCQCDAFEPDRPALDPSWSALEVTHESPTVPGFRAFEPPTLRAIPLGACRHPAYAVDVEGAGVPLRCLDCGEELAE